MVKPNTTRRIATWSRNIRKNGREKDEGKKENKNT